KAARLAAVGGAMGGFNVDAGHADAGVRASSADLRAAVLDAVLADAGHSPGPSSSPFDRAQRAELAAARDADRKRLPQSARDAAPLLCADPAGACNEYRGFDPFRAQLAVRRL